MLLDRRADVNELLDTFQRPLKSLRLSVTDRCNLRCQYCMPEEEYRWIPRAELLTFEELSRLADVFLDLGVDKIRLTGGEPLLRQDLPRLVEILAAKSGLRDLSMTTNGVLLARHARSLKDAGLQRVTVSVDTLRRERFVQIARRDELQAVLEGVAAAREAGLGLKINMVVIAGVNDDELVEMIEFGRHAGGEVRFIEYMDVAGATHWSTSQVVSRKEILRRLTESYGEIKAYNEDRPHPNPPLSKGREYARGTTQLPKNENDDRISAPAERFALSDGTTFGMIASTTAPFCMTCDRSRLTADGMWYTCLYALHGLDLRAAIRGGLSQQAIASLIADTWRRRADRGAEERLTSPARSVFVPLGLLQEDYHLEMHTRGG